MFDYEKDTRGHYQDATIAAKYHRWHSDWRDPRNWRHLAVAAAERRAVARLLARAMPISTAIDVPTGTGKLAPVFARFGVKVTAVDVSAEMLELAKLEYTSAGTATAAFCVGDITKLGESVPEKHDACVCLRLMHRLPPELRAAALRSIAGVAGVLIASYGVETGWHSMRRALRAKLLGGGIDPLCFTTLEQIRAELGAIGTLVAETAVIPGLSQERLFLVRLGGRR